MPLNVPSIWDKEQLEADRVHAKQLFREERMREPLEEYLDKFEDARDAFENLLESTVDLTQIAEKAAEIVAEPKLLEALRYLAGPPISTDDLKVLVDTSLTRRQLASDPALALRIIDTILLGLDRRRFPWVTPYERRQAGEHERAGAVLASAALLATQKVATHRRNVGKAAQEERVKQALRDAGFEQVRIGKVDHLSKAPKPGQFCGETQLGSKKADIIVGLWDLRTMAIECKVSNSAVNSIKRLNDAEGKAKRWRENFGNQVVPAAVLSGVYDRITLVLTQENAVYIFWAHDLDKLIAWIESTRGSRTS